MLYRGSDFVREVGWIIFDEVHYLRDKERGVVWEESIVMAPKSSRFVFLSATVPNAREFAEWVAKVHQQPCHIVYTDYHPTPLQHYIFPAGGMGLVLMCPCCVCPVPITFPSPQVHQQPCHIVYTDYRPRASPPQHLPSPPLPYVPLCLPSPASPILPGAPAALSHTFETSQKSSTPASPILPGAPAALSHTFETSQKSSTPASPILPGAPAALSHRIHRLPPHAPAALHLPPSLLYASFLLLPSHQVHQQPCHIVYTDYRPTPLQHYIFPAGGMGLFLAVDEKGKFREASFQKAMNAVEGGEGGGGKGEDGEDGGKKGGKWGKGKRGAGGGGPGGGGGGGGGGKKGEESDIYKIVKMIMQRQYDPVIVFSFSRADCEALALQMSRMDLNDDDEKTLIDGIFRNAIDSLAEEDKKLPQMSGMDLNDDDEKTLIDGIFRNAIDSLAEEDKKLPQLKSAPSSRPCLYHALPSPFPSRQARLQALEAKHSAISIPDESSLLALLSLRRQLSSLRAEIRSFLTAPRHALPFLSPGRVVRILCQGGGGGAGGAEGDGEGEGGGEGGEAGGIGNEEDVTVWGVVVNFKKVNRKKGGVGGGEQQDEAVEAAADVAYDVDILTWCVEERSAGRMGPPGGPRKVVRPCRPGEEGGSPLVASFPLTQLDGISAVRLFLPKDLKHKEPREAALKSLQQLLLRAGADGVQMLDPEEDMEVNSSAYRKAVRRAEALEALLASHALASAPDLQVRVRELARKSKLKIALKVLKKEVKAAGGLILKDELKARMRVLRRLEYIDEDEIVRVKGRVACEISSADELVVTELLFSAALADLPPETVVALLSCCVWQEKGAGGAKRPRESLQGPLAQLREIARRIARVQEECKIAVDVETYVASFRPDIMEAVFGWCHGAAFADVLAAADTFEGSLIRAMRRLEELLQEVSVEVSCTSSRRTQTADHCV
ncbi:unnamed protein product [Closterium sp. NIES-53]